MNLHRMTEVYPPTNAYTTYGYPSVWSTMHGVMRRCASGWQTALRATWHFPFHAPLYGRLRAPFCMVG